MVNKYIHVNSILSIANKIECEVLSNISYKETFHPKDMIKIKHKCGKKKTLKIKDFFKYTCTCIPNINKNSNISMKICCLCEKPHKTRTQLCARCNKKKKDIGLSIRVLVYLKEYYKVGNIFDLLVEQPHLAKVNINYKHSMKIKREIREHHRSIEYYKEKYTKWDSSIPQYIFDLLETKPQYELLTISGSKLNPNIHYVCKMCKEEFSQKYKDMATNKSHGCISAKSSGELIVEDFLKKHFKIKIQFDTLKCINPITNRQLPFDIEIIDKNILIEIQGKQHLEFIEYFHGSIENFYYQQRKDDYKKRFAEKKGYKLIYIYYDEIQNGEFKNKILNNI